MEESVVSSSVAVRDRGYCGKRVDRQRGTGTGSPEPDSWKGGRPWVRREPEEQANQGQKPAYAQFVKNVSCLLGLAIERNNLNTISVRYVHTNHQIGDSFNL